MKKAVLLGVALASALTGAMAVTAPANAETLSTFECNDGNLNIKNSLDYKQAIMQLRQHGVNAKSVVMWNKCYKVDVKNKDGSTTVQYYDPYTLQHVSH